MIACSKPLVEKSFMLNKRANKWANKCKVGKASLA